MENKPKKNNRCRRESLTASRILSLFLAVCMILTNILFINPEMISAANSTAAKEEKKFGLTQTKLSLYIGNTFQLETVNNDTDLWGWVEYRSSDMSVAYVESDGLIRAVGAGKADITASYMGQSAVCHVTVKQNNCKLSETEIVLYQGQMANITLTDSRQRAVDYSYFLYNQEDNSRIIYVWDMLEIKTVGDGTFMIRGGKPGKYYLDLSLTNKKEESFSARCKVEIRECGFDSYGVAVAKGKTISVAPENGEIISCIVVGDGGLNRDEKGENRWGEDWDFEYYNGRGTMWEDEWEEWDEEEDEEYTVSEDKYDRSNPLKDEYITMDKKGKIKGAKAGSTKVVIDWKTAYGKMRQDWILVDVTNPEYLPFEERFIVEDGYRNSEYYPKFEGLSANSKVTAVSSDETIIAVDSSWDGELILLPKKAGSTTIKFSADGVNFKQKIQVIDPKWQSWVLVKKGKESEALIADVPEDCEIKWKSANKKIATVTKEGKVKGKGIGNTVITAILEGKTFSCEVTVGSGKGVDAALKGESVLGAAYSQEKRMQKGYYDCSSFVWRAYHEAGINLCGVNYAPTAAELAKKLEAEGKAIAYDYIDADELKPGDLIFLGGADNGRYKGIYHVVMYYGAYYGGWDENSGMVIHSTPGVGVIFESYAWECSYGVAMIARPAP